MKERPILFNAAMVRAILSGQKTQTRRECKPAANLSAVVACQDPSTYRHGQMAPHLTPGWFGDEEGDMQFFCPYGKPGDRLWVRETFQYRGASYDGDGIEDADWFRCYGQGGAPDSWDPDFPYGWCPSRHMSARKLTEPNEQEVAGTTGWVTKQVPAIHMPRWASRITLEIVSVRVERLNNISEQDALAEGIQPFNDGHGHHVEYGRHYMHKAVDSFASLWESIKGDGSWAANPWVWVVEFKRVQEASK